MALILIVDDDSAMRSFLAKALENSGHDSHTASNGQEALDLVQEKKDTYDLILTDVVMPVMDGIELSKELRAINPDMKILFITGFSASIVPSSVQIKSKTPVLTKPFHLNDLIGKINDILDPEAA